MDNFHSFFYIHHVQDFSKLEPDFIMTSLEQSGFAPTGEYQQLNSYENRVFDVKLEKAAPYLPAKETPESATDLSRVVVKFYRPNRWSRLAIVEEHAFLTELLAEGVEAIAPLTQKNKLTLSEYDGLWMAVFPKHRGRIPQEFLEGDLQRVGRALAQIHRIGAQRAFRHRPTMIVEDYGFPALTVLEEWVAPEVVDRYFRAAETILQFLTEMLQPEQFIRLHGDCHRGNLLHNAQGFHFLDFDDCCNGPRAQDLWMLTQGNEQETKEMREEILAGYEELVPWDDNESMLFEPLRGLRIIHYAAWIARRWEDPSFPRLFPNFGSYTYWAEETEALERIAWPLASP